MYVVGENSMKYVVIRCSMICVCGWLKCSEIYVIMCSKFVLLCFWCLVYVVCFMVVCYFVWMVVWIVCWL